MNCDYCGEQIKSIPISAPYLRTQCGRHIMIEKVYAQDPCKTRILKMQVIMFDCTEDCYKCDDDNLSGHPFPFKVERLNFCGRFCFHDFEKEAIKDFDCEQLFPAKKNTEPTTNKLLN